MDFYHCAQLVSWIILHSYLHLWKCFKVYSSRHYAQPPHKVACTAIDTGRRGNETVWSRGGTWQKSQYFCCSAPPAPRRAALGQRDTKVGSDSSSSCGDTGGGREAAGQGMGIDNWSHIIFCPADCLPIVVQLLVTLYLMRLRRLFALTNAFSLTMKNSRPIFVFLDAWGAGEYFRYLNKTHMIPYFASTATASLHDHWWPGAWWGKGPPRGRLCGHCGQWAVSRRHAGLSLVHSPVTWPPAALWLVSWAPRVPVQTAASVESRKSSSGQNISPKMQEFNFLTLTNIRENGLKISSVLS